MLIHSRCFSELCWKGWRSCDCINIQICHRHIFPPLTGRVVYLCPLVSCFQLHLGHHPPSGRGKTHAVKTINVVSIGKFHIHFGLLNVHSFPMHLFFYHPPPLDKLSMQTVGMTPSLLPTSP